MNKKDNLNKISYNLSDEELNTIAGGDLNKNADSLTFSYCDNWTCIGCSRNHKNSLTRICICGMEVSCSYCSLNDGNKFGTNCAHYYKKKSEC